MDLDAYENATKEFNSRYPNINWESYCNNNPFEYSAFALYKWAPIADELKKFDKQIVLNSVFLKWNNIQKDFKKLVNNFLKLEFFIFLFYFQLKNLPQMDQLRVVVSPRS